MSLIDAAREAQAARPARRIDYDRMQRTFPIHKRKVDAALRAKDAEAVAAACVEAMNEWDEIGAWPDDWSHWRALDDVLPWHSRVLLEDLPRGTT